MACNGDIAQAENEIARENPAAKSQIVGVLGIGQVGSAVAHNLLRNGFNVKYYFDPNTEMPIWGRQQIVDNLERLNSVKEVGEKCDIVISAVGKPHEIREAALGPDGLFEGLSEGKMWIDHTTTSYEQTRELTIEANKRGFIAVEAPITGGLAALRKGEMAAYLGGEKSAVEQAKPFISASCSTQIYLGPTGTASIAKIMSNTLNGVNLIAGCEALMVAKKADIDLRRFWDAIRVSSGTSFTWETAVPFIFNQNYETDFAIDLHCKDFKLGAKIFENYEVPMEINGLTQQIFNRARSKFGKEAGCYIASKLLEDDMHESLQHGAFKNWDYDLEVIDGSLLVRHKNIKKEKCD